LKGSVILALLVALIGLVLLTIGLYNFYELFFIGSFTGLENASDYARAAVAPAVLGVLLILDGIIVIGLRTKWVLLTLSLANVLWALGAVQLVNLLLIKESALSAYRQPFLAVAGALVFFILSGMIDALSGRRR